MVKKSKLLNALDAHKGRDYAAERQKKLQKSAEKKKRSNAEDDEVENNAHAGNGEKEAKEDDKKPEEAQPEEEDDEDEVEGEEDEDEEDDEDIPLSDLDEDDKADVIPHQRLTINNSTAINASLKRITFINDQMSFSEHNSLVSTDPIEVPDPNDDLARELAFYQVCVNAARSARSLLKKEGVPYSRPTDFFAEMVKNDEHMGKVKKKLYDEAAAKKASAEARRQRDLKKFGKQVQVAKLQQRQKEKRETLEKISSLKRKRRAGDGPTEDEELFDVALEDASKEDKRRSGGPGGAPTKRQKKDQKFGYGGKKRFAKSGDAVSSGDLGGFSSKKMKAGGRKGGAAKRPGKARRAARG